MTWPTITGLVLAGLYAVVLVAIVVAAAKTPPLYQARIEDEPVPDDEQLPAVEDEAFVAALAAHLKAYAETVADYYDTEGTQ